MPTELTESQKEELLANPTGFTKVKISMQTDWSYDELSDFVKENAPSKSKHSKPQKVKVDPKDIVPYAELLKERAAVTPDPKRKWERPPATYSNQQYDDLINKILNDE